MRDDLREQLDGLTRKLGMPAGMAMSRTRDTGE